MLLQRLKPQGSFSSSHLSIQYQMTRDSGYNHEFLDVFQEVLWPGKYHDPGLLRSYQLNAENCHHFKIHLLYSQLLELKDCITTILSRLKRTVLKYVHVIDVATVTVAAQCFGIQVCTVQYASDGTSMMVYCFSLINLRSLLNCLNMLLHNLRSQHLSEHGEEKSA